MYEDEDGNSLRLRPHEKRKIQRITRSSMYDDHLITESEVRPQNGCDPEVFHGPCARPSAESVQIFPER